MSSQGQASWGDRCPDLGRPGRRAGRAVQPSSQDRIDRQGAQGGLITRTGWRVQLATRRPGLFVEGSVDNVFQSHTNPPTLRDRLRHEDDEHIFLRVDPERGAPGSGPIHLAD